LNDTKINPSDMENV